MQALLQIFNGRSFCDCVGYFSSCLRPLVMVTGTNPTFSYDNANRRTGMTDSTGTTNWASDAGNRLTSITTPTYPGSGANNVVSYSYDNDNRRTGVTLNSSTSWSYSFRNDNRISSVTNPYSETTSYSYDATGRTTQVTAANSSTTSYGYDSRNRTTSVSPIV